MAWTVSNNLRDHIGGTGDLESAFAGGNMIVRNSSNATLVECEISSSTYSDGVLTLEFNIGVVGESIDNQTATNAIIRNSSDQALLTTDSVGTSGANINFNEVTGWSQDDTVSPGDVDITLVITAEMPE